VSIAIVDEGVDYTHPALGGNTFPNGKVVDGYDFFRGRADPYPYSGGAHGTACAGIAAGDFADEGDFVGGAAPGASIYGFNVFNFSGGAPDDLILAAWDYCLDHANDNPAEPLLVISNSLGGGRFTEVCDGDPDEIAFRLALGALEAAGIAVFASAGNEGFCDSISSPACHSRVISVGSVFDANIGEYATCPALQGTCLPTFAASSCTLGFAISSGPTSAGKVAMYSNSASFLDLLAPAEYSYTTDIVGSAGYAQDDYAPNFGGTSAACPYAAGTAAVLQSASMSLTGRYLSPSEIRTLLSSTGAATTDPKSGVTKPLVNAEKALLALQLPDGQAMFLIGNEGAQPLVVQPFEATAAGVSAGWITFTDAGGFTLDPGEKRAILTTVDFASAPQGLRDVTVEIRTNDSIAPTSTLHISTSVLPSPVDPILDIVPAEAMHDLNADSIIDSGDVQSAVR
jgi:subtilisin family serine protease